MLVSGNQIADGVSAPPASKHHLPLCLRGYYHYHPRPCHQSRFALSSSVPYHTEPVVVIDRLFSTLTAPGLSNLVPKPEPERSYVSSLPPNAAPRLNGEPQPAFVIPERCSGPSKVVPLAPRQLQELVLPWCNLLASVRAEVRDRWGGANTTTVFTMRGEERRYVVLRLVACSPASPDLGFRGCNACEMKKGETFQRDCVVVGWSKPTVVLDVFHQIQCTKLANITRVRRHCQRPINIKTPPTILPPRMERMARYCMP